MTFLLKKLPIIIGVVFLIGTCCTVLTIDLSDGVEDSSESPTGSGPFEPPTGPVDPPSSAYCERVGDAGEGNPFRGWPVEDVSFKNTAFITASFCDESYSYGWDHEGLDFGFWLGTGIVATANAEVAQIGYQTMLGNTVVLCSGDWCARYAHMQELNSSLVVGSAVSVGTILGTAGSTGDGADGVHLHYDIYNSNGFWDPFPTLFR